MLKIRSTFPFQIPLSIELKFKPNQNHSFSTRIQMTNYLKKNKIAKELLISKLRTDLGGCKGIAQVNSKVKTKILEGIMGAG